MSDTTNYLQGTRETLHRELVAFMNSHDGQPPPWSQVKGFFAELAALYDEMGSKEMQLGDFLSAGDGYTPELGQVVAELGSHTRKTGNHAQEVLGSVERNQSELVTYAESGGAGPFDRNQQQ